MVAVPKLLGMEADRRNRVKKLLNDPYDHADEAFDGLCLAHPEIWSRGGVRGRVFHRTGGVQKSTVGLFSGDGSGRLPVFTGYRGECLFDACAIGNVFAGPTAADCMDAIELAGGGTGVLRLYGNHGGDRMNFDMAGELLETDVAATPGPLRRWSARSSMRLSRLTPAWRPVGPFGKFKLSSASAYGPASRNRDTVSRKTVLLASASKHQRSGNDHP